MSDEPKPLTFYLKAHARYILPTWAFPIYFIAWGLACRTLPYNRVFVLFWILVAPPFFGVFIWSHRVRKEIPYWKYVFLTMTIPFFIFVAIGVILAAGQWILETLHH